MNQLINSIDNSYILHLAHYQAYHLTKFRSFISHWIHAYFSYEYTYSYYQPATYLNSQKKYTKIWKIIFLSIKKLFAWNVRWWMNELSLSESMNWFFFLPKVHPIHHSSTVVTVNEPFVTIHRNRLTFKRHAIENNDSIGLITIKTYKFLG